MSHVAECLRLEGSETASTQYEALSVKVGALKCLVHGQPSAIRRASLQTMVHALAAPPDTKSQLSKDEKVRIDGSYHHDIGSDEHSSESVLYTTEMLCCVQACSSCSLVTSLT